MQRPCLCWTTESLQGVLEGVSITENVYWDWVTTQQLMLGLDLILFGLEKGEEQPFQQG